MCSLPLFNFSELLFVANLFTVQVLYAIAFKTSSLQNVNHIRGEIWVTEVFLLSGVYHGTIPQFKLFSN